MNLSQVVDQREKGDVPVSIGTALAISAAEGTYPDRPVNPPPIQSVESVFINVRTLLRNLIGAVGRDARSQMQPKYLIPALLEELYVLDANIKERTSGRCQAVFYLSEYRHLKDRAFDGALHRFPATPKQQHDATLEAATLTGLLVKELPDAFRHFPGAIQGQFPKSLIITHCPVDLLARYQFQKLDLLESHTGAIKPFAMWGSKLNGQGLDHIPLNAFTLKVFGDGVHFNSQRPSLKKALLEVAATDRWTGLTTLPLIKQSIGKVRDPELRQQLEALL